LGVQLPREDFNPTGPGEVVWTRLNDPGVLKVCIFACEELENGDDEVFARRRSNPRKRNAPAIDNPDRQEVRSNVE
jgi:hypothetical protein